MVGTQFVKNVEIKRKDDVKCLQLKIQINIFAKNVKEQWHQHIFILIEMEQK